MKDIVLHRRARKGRRAGVWSISRRATSAQDCTGRTLGRQLHRVTGTGSVWALHTPGAAPLPELDGTGSCRHMPWLSLVTPDIKSIKNTKSVSSCPKPRTAFLSQPPWCPRAARGDMGHRRAAGMGLDQSRIRPQCWREQQEQLSWRCWCSGTFQS